MEFSRKSNLRFFHLGVVSKSCCVGCCWKYFCFSFPSADQTLVSGATGEDVVDACIQKINNIPAVSVILNNDFGFFKRIALVESNFGQSTNLPFVQGGIWQVDIYELNLSFDTCIIYFRFPVHASLLFIGKIFLWRLQAH